MSPWMTAILIAVSLIAYQILINCYRLHRLGVIAKSYTNWICSSKEGFAEYEIELRTLLRRAGVKDATLPVAQRIGLGQIATFQASAFDNASVKRTDIASHIIGSIDNAKGVYKKNIRESLNPLCWVEFLLFLPNHLLEYLNVKKESTLIRVIQVIWWLLTPAAIVFRDKIYELVTKAIQ